MKNIFRAFIGIIFFIFSAIGVFAADFSNYKTDGGQTVIVQEIHDNPIVIIDTWIKTGSINETDENNGTAHFLEHLFFKGTSKHPAKEFDQILESKGAITNAATSKDFTHYYILIPSKYFDLAADLHADMLLNPMIPRKELEKERKVVIEEISRSNDKPTNKMYKNMIAKMYETHPYKRDVLGTKKNIETVSREQILDFYNKYYTPNNMTTVIVGDVNASHAFETVKAKFKRPDGQIAKNTKKPVYKQDKKPQKTVEVKENLPIETGYILIGFKGVHPITAKDSYTLDLLATILGDGKSSRLYKELKEQKKLVRSISTAHSSMKEDSLFLISANFDTDNIETIKNEIFGEIDKLAKNGVPDEEIAKAKKIIERDTFYSRESISNIAGEIGYTVTLSDDMNYYKNYLSNINKVTAKEIKRAAKQYLNKNSAVISIILPEKGLPDTTKADISETSHRDIPSEKLQQIGTALKFQNEHKAQIVSTNGKTTKYLLENGAELIITDSANDIIALRMACRGGNNLERIPGTASVTADVMTRGTQKYTKRELAQILEENGIIITPSASGDSFSISAKYTKNENDKALELLSEISKKAALEDSEINNVKSDKENAVKNRKNNPDSLAFDEYLSVIRKDTPYGNTGKVLEKTIPQITKEDVKSFYKNLFPAQDTVIVVSGNVNAGEYINYFSELLENTGKPKINLASYKAKYKPLTEKKIVKTVKDTQAAWIIAGWLTDGLTNEKDWAALQVIDAILGSGMSSRLFTELRDDKGLAYQTGSDFSAQYNGGVFTAYIATNPETATVAKEGIFKEIEKLKKEFITEKELSEAKDKLCGNFVLSLETNAEKAAAMNSYELVGKGYEFIDRYNELIQSVTVKDIIRTANRYFNRPYVFTALGPQKSVEKL